MNCIYQIKSKINNRVYIGKTNNFNRRVYEHERLLKKGTHYNPFLQRHFNKYGDIFKEVFDITIIENNLQEECIYEKEIYYINIYNAHNKKYGFNLTKGGYGTMGRKMSEEHKAKLRMSQKPKSEEAKRMQHEMFRGKPSTRVGFKMTEEQKEKMRESHKTRPLTDLVIACRNSAKSKKIVYGYNFETKEKLEFKSIRKAGEYCKSISIARNILYNRYYKHPVFYFSFTDFNESNLINVIK